MVFICQKDLELHSQKLSLLPLSTEVLISASVQFQNYIKCFLYNTICQYLIIQFPDAMVLGAETSIGNLINNTSSV